MHAADRDQDTRTGAVPASGPATPDNAPAPTATSAPDPDDVHRLLAGEQHVHLRDRGRRGDDGHRRLVRNRPAGRRRGAGSALLVAVSRVHDVVLPLSGFRHAPVCRESGRRAARGDMSRR